MRAKPAVPVAGVPLVRRIIQWLVTYGVTDIILNLHHRPDTITTVVGDGRDLGARVRYSWEPRLLGSGGGPRRALPLFDTDRCFIINGDTLTDVDLKAMIETHLGTSAAVTLALVPNPDPWWYGGVVLDDAGRILKFTTSFRRAAATTSGATPHQRPQPGASGRQPDLYHFVGVQIVERRIFSTLPEGEPAESVSGLYRTLIAQGTRVQAFTCHAAFHDIGTPTDYLRTSLRFARAEGHDTIPAGVDTSIGADARIERTAIWDRVSIGPGCQLIDCIVTDDVQVPAGTALSKAILIAENRCAAVDDGRIIGNARTFPLDEGAR